MVLVSTEEQVGATWMWLVVDLFSRDFRFVWVPSKQV